MSRKSQTTRRSVLTATGAVSLLGLAGVASGSASSGGVPIPDDADERTYPTVGTNSDAPTASFYGNFKCPSSQGFVSGNLQEIVSEFVSEGLLNVEFCNLAYEPGSTSQYFISDSDPRLAAVGLAVWDEDPSSYWQFVTETYSDMPSGHVGYDELESRARSAGVSNVEACIERAQAGEYEADVEQVATLADGDGISYTPQLELAGDTTAPHHGTQAIIDWLDARLDAAPGGEKSEDKLEDDADDEDVETESDDEDVETESDDEDVEEPQEESEIEDSEGDAETDDGDDGDDEEEVETDDETDEDYDDDGETVEDGEEVDSDGEEDEADVGDSDDDDDDDTSGDTSSGGSSGGIGAGEDYDLSDDRTIDDIPVDC
ncbi:DsbA family protein [Natronococcus sp.]|uniref:DsbA family protein n=1 Tax=Natronococcus sp. TaxID=35747 RepID=UPI003A4E2291